MSPAEVETFRTWLRDVILPTASERDNNWGDAGTFARIALTSYLGDTAGFDAAVARWREMMDFVAADGHIPEEVRRESKGIMYTQEALQYKVGSAVIAARRGVDLWDYQGSLGGTLKGSIDYLVSYLHEPDQLAVERPRRIPDTQPDVGAGLRALAGRAIRRPADGGATVQRGRPLRHPLDDDLQRHPARRRRGVERPVSRR